MVLVPSTLMAEESIKVGVLYPDVKNSVFGRVFDEILQGVKQNDNLDIIVYTLSKDENVAALEDRLKRDGISAVIALGQRSYGVGQKLAPSFPVVHGGVMIEPNGHSGISLVIDPKQFFSRLIDLAPTVKRVYTVYSEKSNGWMIQMAEQAAKEHNIELLASRANSLREGMFKLKEILDTVQDEHDAVWLLLDQVVPEKAALPIVLEKAWDSRIVVFSNNPSHTRRGALFALFPDHVAMGYRLGKLAYQQQLNSSTPLVLPSQDLKISVNERTASHLGFSITPGQRGEFDLVYPVQ